MTCPRVQCSPTVWLIVAAVLTASCSSEGSVESAAATSTTVTQAPVVETSVPPPSTTATPTTQAAVTTTVASTVAPTTTTSPLPTMAAPLITAPDGYEVFDGTADGFVVAIPSRWVPLDLSAGDIETLLAEGGQGLEREALEFISASLGVTDFALFAIDFTGDPNMNVITVPAGPLDRLDIMESIAVTAIEETFGGTVTSVAEVSVDGAQALRLAFEVVYPAGSSEQHQYYVLAGDLVYIITLTSFDPGTDGATFDTVMETFTFVDG